MRGRRSSFLAGSFDTVRWITGVVGHIRLCVACDVHIGESDLVTVSYCGSSQRAVFHDVAVNSMSPAFALTISPDAFREFVQQLCTCQ